MIDKLFRFFALLPSLNGAGLFTAKRLIIVTAAAIATLSLTPPFQSNLKAFVLTTASETNEYGDPDLRKETLDSLFVQLKASKAGFVAQAIIEQIWLVWHQSGRTDIDDLLSRAKINSSEGEFESALNKLDEVIERAPDFAEGWNGRATVFFHMGRYAHSLSDIEETLKREPRHFGALAGRGRIYLALGDDAAALAAFNEAARHNPFLAERESLVPAIRKRLGIRDL